MAFLEGLEKLLKKYDVSLEEQKLAIELIRETRKNKAVSKLVTSGECVYCLKKIKITKYAVAHVRGGNDWYYKFLNAFRAKKYLNIDYLGDYVNGYAYNTFCCYACNDCIKKVDDLHAEKVALREARKKPKKETPSSRFYDMTRQMTDEISAELAAMPYKDFLDTVYWSIVRDYVRYKGNYKCSLCYSSENLQVHHRHYKTRGKEYKDITDCLILLCRNCHSKFHDKEAK